jgi:hypothetical protein
VDFRPQPFLYILTQEHESGRFFCSANREDDMNIEVLACLSSLEDVYRYIKDNSNTDAVKISKSGNLIVEYRRGE